MFDRFSIIECLIVILVLAGMAWIAYTAIAKPWGECLASHTVTEFMPVNVGNNSTVLMPYQVDVCDRWQYPNGRPQEAR